MALALQHHPITLELTERETLLVELRDQVLNIPDLKLLFSEWPQAISSNLDILRALAAEKIKGLAGDDDLKQKILSKIDSGLFSAAWWPMASAKRGDVLSCLAMWLFIWDDEMDAEVGELASDFEVAQSFRLETLSYIEYCLSLTATPQAVPPNQVIAFFKLIGDAVCETYDKDHRELLYAELKFFIDASAKEQERRLSPFLPSVDEYINTRTGTSAVNVTTFFNEYAADVKLPISVLLDPDMQVVWDQTNIIVWAVNDLLSIQKEVKQQTVDSMLPLLYHQCGDIQTAVLSLVDMIKEAKEKFDGSAEELMRKFGSDQQIYMPLRCYIEACQQNCTGNLYWSLRTQRYGVSDEEIAGGVTISL